MNGDFSIRSCGQFDWKYAGDLVGFCRRACVVLSVSLSIKIIGRFLMYANVMIIIPGTELFVR